MATKWQIYIPVRPKAVQSVRGGRGGFYPDPKVRKWKAAIEPYIKAECKVPPTEKPLKINIIRYMFKRPDSLKKKVREYIDNGGLMPYIGSADITDNLAKGLIDVCAGNVFVNDKQIWQISNAQKVYAAQDAIYIEFEETPDVPLPDGTNL